MNTNLTGRSELTDPHERNPMALTPPTSRIPAEFRPSELRDEDPEVVIELEFGDWEE